MTSLHTAIEQQRNDHLAWTPELDWRPSSMVRVLIIEDDRDLRNGLSTWLRFKGFDVDAAVDGAAGLSRIEREDPDVVILDLGLPRMHGFKVLHELRQRANRAPRIAVVTASSSPEVARRAIECGADAVFTKPADPAELVDWIDADADD